MFIRFADPETPSVRGMSIIAVIGIVACALVGLTIGIWIACSI